MTLTSWLIWAFVLICQNFAFTFVSRARNSGSLKRHVVAAFFSNGIWFVSQILIFTTMFAMMTGKYGVKMAIFTGSYYTLFTITGSVLAHYYSLKTEKGKSAVGANKRFAQIPVEEWEKTKQLIDGIGKLAQVTSSNVVGVVNELSAHRDILRVQGHTINATTEQVNVAYGIATGQIVGVGDA